MAVLNSVTPVLVYVMFPPLCKSITEQWEAPIDQQNFKSLCQILFFKNQISNSNQLLKLRKKSAWYKLLKLKPGFRKYIFFNFVIDRCYLWNNDRVCGLYSADQQGCCSWLCLIMAQERYHQICRWPRHPVIHKEKRRKLIHKITIYGEDSDLTLSKDKDKDWSNSGLQEENLYL